MPKGIYIRTEQHKRNMGLAHLGKKGDKMSLERKDNLRKKMMGNRLWDNPKSRETRFKKGLIPWIKGKIHTDETRRKISESNKGKLSWNKDKHGVYSEETKRRISMASKGRVTSEETKQKIRLGNMGKIFSEDSKRKMSLSRKGIGFSDEHLRNLSTSHKQYIQNNPAERERLKELRRNLVLPVQDTKIETKIQGFLDTLQIEYFTHKYMNIEHGYQCDIFIPSKNLIIECDGDYWHGNPAKFPNPNQMQKEQMEEDACRNEELREKGFKVLRLWETEIRIMKLNEFKEEIKYE